MWTLPQASKSDLPDTLQKGTKAQLFLGASLFLDNWDPECKFPVIAVFMLVALVAATRAPIYDYSLKRCHNHGHSESYKHYHSCQLYDNRGGPSSVGNPSPTALHDNGFTQYAFPTGWAGQICVGPDFNSNGSKIEGSYTGPPDIVVSYVDGYSVPIACSSEDRPVSGCNINLYKQPNFPCINKVEGFVCLNPAQNIVDGSAHPASRPVRGPLTLI